EPVDLKLTANRDHSGGRHEFQVHRFDPIKHGVLSKHVCLPWEDRDEFEEILRGLLVEHAPQGPTAYHLVEDLAGVIWRKRRLLQAEGATIRERLYNVTRGYDHEKVGKYALAHLGEKFGSEVIEAVAGRLSTREEIAANREMIERAFAALKGGKRGGYKRALECLDAATLEAWEDEAADEDDPEAGGYERNAEGLEEFLESTRDLLNSINQDTRSAPLVIDQANGMAIDIRDLDRIAKVEAHLDRKLERLLQALKNLPVKKSA
ncbi:MAG: hypothetical protein AAFY56_12125, partial [Pseudomonadota bacterium]